MHRNPFSNRCALCLAAAAILAVVASTAPDAGAQVTPYPPLLRQLLGGTRPVNAGRMHAIAVHPRDAREAVVSAEVGGLWKTEHWGARWFHLDGLPAVFTRDVTYSPDGETLIATVQRDMRVDNGGGIWISRDGGYSWQRPASARPPRTPRSPVRDGAWGIAWAPGDPSRVYVGTDYGVAVSHDGGASWSHYPVEVRSPVAADSLQGAARSLVALPGDRVVALTATGVYRSDDAGRGWRLVVPGDFSGDWGAFSNVDRSPVDPEQVFILQGYTRLHLYDAAREFWNTVELPGGTSRGQFVRVSRNGHPSGMDVWVGNGEALRRARCPDRACLPGRTVPWETLGWHNGLHEDAGDLGLDGSGRPALYGDDGGLFFPVNADATRWASGAPPGSRMNSYQITDLAGTNVPSWSGHRTSLYFATQDNGIWASADGGRTWPFADCFEGFHLEVRPEAPRDEDVTVAYGSIGCGPGIVMTDAHLANGRDTPSQDLSGNPVDRMGNTFLVAPGAWVRLRTPLDAAPEVWVSTDDGEHWRRRATVALSPMGVFQPSEGRAGRAVYAPWLGAPAAPDGNGRVGLVRLDNPLGPGERALGEADLIYLPDGGSLGQRWTMFDWQAVFGVHPRDPDFILAPDAVNQVVKVSRDGGRSWRTDEDLTRAVTGEGTFLLYDAAPARMQVTHIGFDPFDDGRILVGTRDAGVVISTDGGAHWGIIPGTEQIKYVTGFFFHRDGTIVVSSYGMGLWTLDVRERPGPLPRFIGCLWGREWRAPAWWEFGIGPWRCRRARDLFGRDDLLVVFGGRITGLDYAGDTLRGIRVTPGTRYARYTRPGTPRPPLVVREDSATNGMRAMRRGLRVGRGAWITGLVLEDGRVRQALSSRGPLLRDDPERGGTPVQHPAPYLFVNTSRTLAGMPVLGEDGALHLRGTGFHSDPAGETELRVEIDGRLVRRAVADTLFTAVVQLGDTLAAGEHTVRMVQRGGGVLREATARFVVPVLEGERRQDP